MRGEHGEPSVEGGQGEQQGSTNVAQLANKLLGTARVEDEGWGILG